MLYTLSREMAATREGVIQDLDYLRGVIILRDGTELWMPQSESFGGLSRGLDVRVRIVEKEGKYWVAEIRPKNVSFF